ncbi:MAG: hypothetical protein V4592_12915 [Bacteroidota bacterium]
MIALPALKARAQDFFPEQKDYAVRVSADFERPGKDLENYKAAVVYSTGFLKFFDDFTLGINMAYREFAPKAQMIVQQIDAGHQSVSTYSNYSTFLFYLSGVYNYPFTERVTLFGGLNAGLGYNTSGINYRDDNSDVYLGGDTKQAYFAPKLGAGFALNNNVSIDIHACYNIFMQSGNLNNIPASGNTAVLPSGYSSISTGIGMVFKF